MQYRLCAKETAITFTDQIPVWLKVEAGSQLISEARLQEQSIGQSVRRANRKAAQLRKQGDEPEAGKDTVPEQTDERTGQSYLVKGPGSTSAARWRVSLLARQSVENYFDPSRDPTGSLDSDLLLRPTTYHLPT